MNHVYWHLSAEVPGRSAGFSTPRFRDSQNATLYQLADATLETFLAFFPTFLDGSNS